MQDLKTLSLEVSIYMYVDLNFDNVIFVQTNTATSVSLFLNVVSTACNFY